MCHAVSESLVTFLENFAYSAQQSRGRARGPLLDAKVAPRLRSDVSPARYAKQPRDPDDDENEPFPKLHVLRRFTEWTTPVIEAEARLISSSLRFDELAAKRDFVTAQAYHEVGAAIRTLCAALANAEAGGMTRPRMRELVKEASAAHALSPFVNRLQTWPQGYPGDFLTVEHLISQKNQADVGTLAYLIERYCLATEIAQQHRNKMQHQSALILRSLLRGQYHGATPKVLVLAAGSSPDLRAIMDLIAEHDFRVVLNDSDPEALEHSLTALAPIANRLVALDGNALRCADEIRELGPYDLVVAGGLFDYLNSNWATQFVSLIMNQWLAPAGEFFFTNIAAGNPYRLWMECVTDWEVIERTEQDLVDLVAGATSACARTLVTREATSLTLLAIAGRASD